MPVSRKELLYTICTDAADAWGIIECFAGASITTARNDILNDLEEIKKWTPNGIIDESGIIALMQIVNRLHTHMQLYLSAQSTIHKMVEEHEKCWPR